MIMANLPAPLRHRQERRRDHRFRKVVGISGWSRHPIFWPGGSAASGVPASLGLGQSIALRVAGGEPFGGLDFQAFWRLSVYLCLFSIR
jgi:hypothetical protein